MDSPTNDDPTAESEKGTADATAEATASTTPEAVPVPQRSPVEKFLVRMLILVLVLFAAVEARAKFGFDMTRKGIEEEFAPDKKLDELAPNFKLFPSREWLAVGNRGGQILKLKWFSFVKYGQYEIEFVLASDKDDALVLGFTTPEADDIQRPVKPRDEGKRRDGNPDGGPGMAIGTDTDPPRGGGGRPKFDPQAFVKRIMDNDKNKDGKLTKDEMDSDRSKRFFDRADADKDGTVTDEEVKKAVASFSRGGGRKRSGRGGNKRKRQRPAMEDDEKTKTAKSEKTNLAKTEKTTPAKKNGKTQPAKTTTKEKTGTTQNAKGSETKTKKTN